MDQILTNLKTLNTNIVQYCIAISNTELNEDDGKLVILNSMIGRLDSYVNSEYTKVLNGEKCLTEKEKNFLKSELKENDILEKLKPIILMYIMNSDAQSS